jgi:hypothetical protein
VLEDPTLELVQLAPGFEAELVHESLARCPKRVQRVRLASGAI